MSYKKIVAGVATAVVASALVVPSAFALSSSEYNDLKDDARYTKSADFEKVMQLEEAFEATKTPLKEAKEATQKAKTTLDEKRKALNEKPEDQTAKDEFSAAQVAYDKAVDAQAKAQKAYDDAKALFENKRDGLKETEAQARTSKAYKDADSDSKKFAEDQVKAGKDLLVDIRTTDLTSLSKTYRDQVRTIQTKGAALEKLVKEIDDNYKNWEPAKRQAKAEELKQLIAVVKGALSEIPDAVLKDAKKADKKDVKAEKKDVKVAKKGSALPKTSDVAPVAPIAAVAGSAALIAAGLVASRKVNA